MLRSWLQLCRPLSGAVRRQGARHARVDDPQRFNCAAPFRERLVRMSLLKLRRIPGFNCAAPFRERLVGRARRAARFLAASIVPPPFGSG